jgi:tellurite resistance protein TerC
MFSNETLFFIGFAAFVLVVMLLDLGVFSNKKSDVVTFKEAGIWSGIWVILAIAFYFFIQKFGYLIHGINDMARLTQVRDTFAAHVNFIPDGFEQRLQVFQNNMALEYITGYLVEYSLSADNIFVFILIFNSFGVAQRYIKKILVWGILGAIVLRFIFIFVGSALLQRFEWIILIFGAFLVYTGLRLFFQDDDDDAMNPSSHPVVKLASKYFNVYKRNVTDRFFIYHKYYKKWYITPLFVIVIVIAFTDLVFAVDSIPAIFSITKDPYIVFFSNVFAIMGLRSMFFFLSSIMDKFYYLKYGLAVLLTFIGAKMLSHTYLEEMGFKTIYSLYIIVGILATAIVGSWLFPPKKNSNK